MGILDDVLTLQEAATAWDMDTSALSYAIKQKKFSNNDIRKSGNTWFVLRSAMYNMYGNPRCTLKTRNIFTIGYEGKTTDEFISILKTNNIDLLLDVRELPLSRKKGFSKTALSSLLKEKNIEYVHFSNLGSPKEIRHKLRSDHNYEDFFQKYKEHIQGQYETLCKVKDLIEVENKNVCLLCFEKEHNICHRSVLAREILNLLDHNLEILNI